MKRSKAAIIVSQMVAKFQLVSGRIISVTALLMIIIGVSESMPDGFDGTVAAVLVFCFFCLAGGLALVKASKRRSSLITNFREYAARLSSDPERSITDLAAAVNRSTEDVLKELQQMVDKQYFINAMIDYRNNRMIFLETSHQLPVKELLSENAVNGSQTVHFVTTCRNCGGANHVIRGSYAECDFCGSPISTS